MVSGAKLNPCGHALLNTADSEGIAGGWYFHVDAIYDYPRYMDDNGYRVYLKDNGKTELYRHSVNIPDPEGAMLTLDALMAKKWAWGVLAHNCGTFVEKIVEGGGGTAYPLINCPHATPKARSIKAPIGPPQRMGP